MKNNTKRKVNIVSDKSMKKTVELIKEVLAENFGNTNAVFSINDVEEII